jgi:hypothetical protein
MKDDPEVVATVFELARYLRANPLACDAPDGIRRWWLPFPPAAMEKLLMALERMKELGLIEETCAADGRVRYRRIASDQALDALGSAGPWTMH